MSLKNASVAIYGTLAYLLFLGTYTYIVGFVLGLAVPKHLDTVQGEVPTLTHAILVNLGLLTLFAVQHLIMARDWFKALITRYIPESAERSTFVVATCGALIAMVVFWQPIPQVVWQVDSSVWRGVLYGLGLLGFAGVVYTTFLIDHFGLFGLKQSWSPAVKRQTEDPPFLVKSLYRMARHPMYTCMLLGFWATPAMTVGHLLFSIGVTGFIFLGVQFEERGLINKHGVQYLLYRDSLPMLFPRFGVSHPALDESQATQQSTQQGAL